MPLRAAINGWFAGREVGSGQYTDLLARALAAASGPDEAFEVIHGPGGGPAAKTWFEQVRFPHSARFHDLAHVPYWGPPLRAPCPVVVTVHDLIPLLLPEYRRRFLVRVYARLAATGSRRAAAVLTDAMFTAGEVERHLGIPRERIHAIPLGVETRFSTDAEPSSVRATYGLPERFGLYVGGFDVRKNLAVLLRAWRAVHESTGTCLVIAGRVRHDPSGLYPDPAAIAAQVGLPDAAYRCIGHVSEEDKPGLYRAAAVFAYPSRYEGFGLPPLEAMACGTPTVAADATSLPEVVGDAGVLLDPGDEAAWAAALLAVLEDVDLAGRLREAGPARARTFTWARAAARTRGVYDVALGRGEANGPADLADRAAPPDGPGASRRAPTSRERPPS